MILVTGDSHSKFWKGRAELELFGVNDATAYALWDGQRFSEKGKALWDHLGKHRKRYAAMMACFGEIDMRAHAVKHGNVVAIADRYAAFLRLANEMVPRLIVWGPPSSQGDERAIDPQFPRFGTQAERNAVTAEFDNLMMERVRCYVPVSPHVQAGDLHDGVHLGEHFLPAGKRLVREALARAGWYDLMRPFA